MCVGITRKLIKRLRFIEGPKTLFLPSAPSDSNTMEVWETKRCLHCVSSVTAKREMIIERNSTFPCFAFVPQISVFFWKIYIQINIFKKIRRQQKLIIPRFSGALMHLHRFLSAWNPFSRLFPPQPPPHPGCVPHRPTSDLCPVIPHYCLPVLT